MSQHLHSVVFVVLLPENVTASKMKRLVIFDSAGDIYVLADRVITVKTTEGFSSNANWITNPHRCVLHCVMRIMYESPMLV